MCVTGLKILIFFVLSIWLMIVRHARKNERVEKNHKENGLFLCVFNVNDEKENINANPVE